jgi:hypothetical protein
MEIEDLTSGSSTKPCTSVTFFSFMLVEHIEEDWNAFVVGFIKYAFDVRAFF